MLRARSIFSEPSQDDGRRISVMSRHTLPDGITPDPRLSAELYDEHWPALGPPATLIGAYYKRDLPWHSFAEQYTEHLRSPEAAARLADLIALAVSETVTVLCVEETPDRCHRRLLVEECLRQAPEIAIEVL